MIILLHILYIYTEYLWSCLVNRNRLSEPEDNSANNSVEYERNNEFGAVRCRSESNFSSNDTKSEVKTSESVDNLESEPSSSDRFGTLKSQDRYSFHDDFVEYEEAVYDYETKKITFFPPVYIQRYVSVVNILKDDRWRGEIKKVVDIGCSELGFFKFLKDIDGVEKILEIDIDKNLLQEYSYRIQPWVSDFLKDRPNPLEVTLLCGNAALPDRHLEGVDAVIGIELIEHLFPRDLDDLPINIFGNVKPRLAIFTTPNEEFNILFHNFTGFRHYDHKFEWKRYEFESWAKNICSRFPDYEVNFFGIGPGPKGKAELGCCSQGAVFFRNSSNPTERLCIQALSSYEEYEVIDHVEYPFRKDSRSEDRIIFDEAVHYINVVSKIGNYHNGERTEIPLGIILMRVYKKCDSLDKLKRILEDENYKVEKDKDGDFVVIVPDEFSDSEDDVENDEFDVENLTYIINESGNDIVSEDWDSVEQDGISWVTDENLQAKEISGCIISDNNDNLADTFPYYNKNCDDFNYCSSSELVNKFESSDNIHVTTHVSEDDVLKDYLEKSDNQNSISQDKSSSSHNKISSPLMETKTGEKVKDDIILSTICSISDSNSYTCDLNPSSKFLAISESLQQIDENKGKSCLDYENLSDVMGEEKEIFVNSLSLSCVPESCNKSSCGSYRKDDNHPNAEMELSYPITDSVFRNKKEDKDFNSLNNTYSVLDLSMSQMSCNQTDKSKGDEPNIIVDVDKKQSCKINSASIELKKDVFDIELDLTANSAYELDECIESVQEKIRNFNLGDEKEQFSVESVGFNFKETSLFTNLDDHSNTYLMEDNYDNKKLPVACKESVLFKNTKSIHDLFESDIGNESCKVQCSSVQEGTSSNICSELSSGGEFNRSETSVKILPDDLKESMGFKSSKSINDLFKSDSGSKSPSVLCNNVQERPLSCVCSESVNSTEFDNEISETSVSDSNCKQCGFFYLNCSSFSSNFLKLNNLESDGYSSDKERQLEELINPNNFDVEKVEIFSNVSDNSFSSNSLLSYNKKEKIVQTHIDKTDPCSKLKDELWLSKNVECFERKNNEKMLRSYSLGEFDPYPIIANNLLINSPDSVPRSVFPADNCEFRKKLNYEKYADRKPFEENFVEDDDTENSLNDYLQAGMERQDSFSPDKAGDSGYPNSNSGRDMEMDSTPEQVKELMTESESSLENSPFNSPVREVPAAPVVIPHPPVVHLGDNVENGDVANNNRDGEGNNVVGQAIIVGEPREYHAVIDHPQEMALMAEAECNIRDCNDNKNKNDKENIDCAVQVVNQPSDCCGPSNLCNFVDKEKKSNLKKSKTFLDKPLSFDSLGNGSKVNNNKSATETNYSSCPESLKSVEDEIELNALSFESLKNWESTKGTESCNIKQASKYSEWYKNKFSENSRSSNNLALNLSLSPPSSSALGSESVPSFTGLSDGTLSESLLSHSVPRYLFPPDIISNRLNNLTGSEDLSLPLTYFDDAIDNVIQDIVEELLTPNLEPFADWLLQIQLEVHSNESDEQLRQGQANNDQGLRVIEEQHNEFNNAGSEQELIVEADVKGGGDTPAGRRHNN